MRMLQGAAMRSRVASSYLFCGEDGIGKRFAAVNLAKALNCLHPVNADGGMDACDNCASCKQIDSATHPDFIMIAPDKGQIKVGQIKYDETSRDEDGNPFRSVEEFLSLKALSAKFRVVIVEEAEKMNESAANAFLKTLEEPPAGSLIILLSSRPDMLPLTIRSRCLRVNFRPLGEADCLSVINAIKPGGGKKSPGAFETAGVLSRILMGRPGLLIDADPLKERDRFMATLDKMLSGDTSPAWKERQDMEKWLDQAMILLRDMAALKATGSAMHLINADKAERIHELCAKTALKVIIDVYGRLIALRGDLVYNLNMKITWNYAGWLMRGLRGGA